ncbi:MAG TPA: ABC transporter ATP-binding protein [Saprospiraceae bacterium]|nr:ABC transporter ATP-binding protein [Saprospiraceae bacterium]
MARSTLKSIKNQGHSINIKEALESLQYIPRFFREIRNSHPTLYAANLCCRIISSFAPVIILWIGKIIIDEIVLQISLEEKDFQRLWMVVGIELIVVVFTDLIGRAITLTDDLLGDLYSNDSSVRIIRKTKDVNISQLEDPEFYDKLERARTQTNSRVNLMSTALSQIQTFIVIVSLIGGLIFFEPWLVIILILSIIPSFINDIKFSTQRYSLARSWTAERRELDYLRYIGANNLTAKEIKLFGLSGFVADRFKYLSHAYYEISKKLAIQRSIYGGLFNVLGTLSYYGAYILIIFRVITGSLTLGELTFLSGSFSKLRSSLQNTFSTFTRISESAMYLRDYFDFMDMTIPSAVQSVQPLPHRIQLGFSVKNLWFTYPGNTEPVLKGISFELKAGEKMAFVGENGAGKTTLIKLLLRFYDPDSGEITLDGIPIQLFDRDTYQQMFGVIFQDFVRYEFPVKENIGIGNVERIKDLERIRIAAERSLASEVVEELPDGYDQQLGRRFIRGKELSGGQWQKIALARAYMKDAEVLILDEPTAALDARAEYEAFQRFIALTQQKTSIIISHRFSTVRMADRILVLKEGKIHELGTHDELLLNQGLYSELFNLQAAGYQ